MFLIVHKELFLLRVILIGLRLVTIPISINGRAKKEPTEIINLNLDSPVSPEITKFWAFSIHKEHLQILSRNYFLMKGKEK